jgi:ubiquinone/menaquinone biosynthesis C-methylase UbiE
MRNRLLLGILGLAALSALPLAHAQNEVPERTPAPVMGFHGAAWLERDTREQEERPDLVLGVMDLKPGMVVADIGCGTGWFSRRIAKEVAPDGIVYGVEIQPEMLDYLVQYAKIENIKNIKPVLGDEVDPKLPRNSIDWMFLADVYHEFQQPEPMLAKMLEALKPTGKVCLLEYREEGDSARHIKPEHRMTARQVLAEWNAAGFELVDYRDFLPSQHLFIFQPRPKRD